MSLLHYYKIWCKINFKIILMRESTKNSLASVVNIMTEEKKESTNKKENDIDISINKKTRIQKEISKPEDFTPSEELYKKLMDTIKRYHPSTDLSMIEKAYKLADGAHKDQRRKSGEPYIIHPLCVAIILAELELDKETIVAGLLHDVVEDIVVSLDYLRKEFNEEVALLVDGVTKLGQLSYAHDKMDEQAENLRKLFLAMAKDIRVILIKLADRLHNMRTLQYMKPEKQQEKARETMDIYAPIADRLGISKIKVELDDLALMYLEPEVYKQLDKDIAEGRENRQKHIDEIVEEVSNHMRAAKIKCEVDGRVKHFFSIYKKMKKQNKSLDQIYDIFAVRVKVNSVRDCYAVLGVIHEMYKPVPGRFKDYIAMPKENMYQSLHTTLVGKNGVPFEIQIRTFEMHRTAEYGIAAHWKYKEGGGNINSEEEKLSWLRQILEWQQEDNKEFLSMLKSDLNLFNDNVYCFTPQGDVKALKAGATPVDFAYIIHSAVGNRMTGARVNGKQVPINYKLQNGDRVEIITTQNMKGPSRDWLSFVATSQAKNKINQWFKNQSREENITKGRDLLEKNARAKGYDIHEIAKPEYQKKCIEKYGLKTWEVLLATIGHGGLKEGQIVNKIIEEYKKDHPDAVPTDEEVEATIQAKNENIVIKPKGRQQSGIIVEGLNDVSVRFSKCCSPVPGDKIVGYVTRGRGLSIHRTDCVNIINLPEEDKNRLMTAEWREDLMNSSTGEKYLAEVVIYANNRTGLLHYITKTFSEAQIDIQGVNTRTSKQGLATIEISFEIAGKEELARVIDKLRALDGIIDVQRHIG